MKAREQGAPPRDGRTLVSVVVPVFNAADDLDRCLAAVNRSDWPALECIVADDASTDERIAGIARRHGARLERMERRGGPALARNAGAMMARGDVIFFTDSDVLLHRDAISQAVALLDGDPSVAAVFGSYDDNPGDGSFLSRYRNLYHHWNHQIGNEEASTFWTGCGAIRKEPFVELGGFSAAYTKPSIEDIELGYRLREAGYRIRLLKTMLGTHLKRWRFLEMVRTDIFRRGVPWMVLLRRHRSAPADLNLNWKARMATVSAALLAVALLLLPLSGHAKAVFPVLILLVVAAIGSLYTRRPGPGKVAGRWDLPLAVVLGTVPSLLVLLTFPDHWALLPLGLVAVIVWAQWGFYRLLAARGGAGFAMAAAPLQCVFFLCCAVSIPLGILASLHHR